MRGQFNALGAVVSVVLLTGCSAGAPGVSATAEHVRDVTYDEYQAAFSAYSSCLEDAGYSLRVDGEENQTVQFSVPSGAVDSGADQKCYEEHFASIDAAWQLERIDTSDSARILRTCLEGLGIVPAETYEEMNQQLFDAGKDPSACSEYS